MTEKAERAMSAPSAEGLVNLARRQAALLRHQARGSTAGHARVLIEAADSWEKNIHEAVAEIAALRAPAPALPQAGVSEEEIARVLAYEEWPHAPEHERKAWTDAHYNRWLRHARAILARLTPAPAVEGWKPIETAPKDGTFVDLLYPYPRGRTINCQWTTDFEIGWHWMTPQWDAGGKLLPESKWFTNTYPGMQPSHWMPIPLPPATQADLENNDAGSERKSPGPVERRER